MNYAILHQIISDLENFQQEQPDKSKEIEDFVFFLNQKYLGQIVAPEPIELPSSGGENSNIGQLIAFMYRYAKSYIKKALEESTILTLADFGYLATIWQYGDLTKTQVIEKNIHEKNTGMEIIKRLIKNGLLEQYDDKKDKRSKRLRITALGKTELLKSFDGMLKVRKIVTGKLNDVEKLQLFHLLNKLHHFHNPIFLQEKETSLEALLEKYF